MINKYVVLNINCPKTPFELTIVSRKGFVIKKLKIKSKNAKICFYTADCCIKILARYNYQVQYKVLPILSCFQSFCINLTFTKIFTPKSRNVIRLTDANYGLPIPNALLYFIQT